ncbi:hypothetical protein A3J13_01765 [Candidatus Daviesbacteria bacterium RIFCSPLOWO2_02_FULL_36_8]|uniref:Glycosyltransferase RgtA/B/C/D-like domain-containing protein n=1 Tax=Candidatus Daviesbacteria bacterium RIFCSPLOWO2_02_FULL_36_8 TaxID=1797793 RepID=A0A1F5MFL5_9BACT|nr:MAG: hypothetical protein A3J13_01765 [Candidatus Daviesbacteria bacterium RIFCSPLOWO2_02_FULL_36_8]
MAFLLAYFRKPWVIALLICLLALFLRTYNLDQIYVFGADEEYQTNIAMSLVKDFHPIWIGVSAANTGFYLGPYWSYFTYIWLFLSRGDVLTTAYVAASLGALTALAIFYVGWKMFSLRVGIISSILYSCLPLIVFYDQKYWNPSTVPLLAITLIYSLYKVRYNQKYWLLFALAYGLVFHVHLSLAPFILLAIYTIRKGIKKRILAGSIVIFILAIFPLVIFDYFHKWSNITTPFRFGEIVLAVHPSTLEKFQSLTESIARVFYLPAFSINANEILAACSKYRSLPHILSIPFIALILIFLFKKNTWRKENSKILGLSILLISLSYILFPGRLDEYYLLGLFPLLSFIPGIIWNKYFSSILIFVVCIAGVVSVLTTYNPYGLSIKKQMISKVMLTVANEPYDLSESGQCHRYEGWRYLFATYGRAPERADIDSAFGWLYPKEIHNTPLKYSVIMTGHDIGNLGFSYELIKQ